MHLSYTARSVEKKCEAKRLRRKGSIPAIVYSEGKPGEHIVIKTSEFVSALKNLTPGTLPTVKFKLKGDGKEREVIVKDIQYNAVTYDVIHLDFLELKKDVAISFNVPIRFEGETDCPGVKLGGVLRPLIRHLKVKCLPKDMPEEFLVDVSDLGLTQSKRLADIALPKNVKPRMNLREVAVTIAKR